jgi:hypothetical protein
MTVVIAARTDLPTATPVGDANTPHGVRVGQAVRDIVRGGTSEAPTQVLVAAISRRFGPERPPMAAHAYDRGLAHLPCRTCERGLRRGRGPPSTASKDRRHA